MVFDFQDIALNADTVEYFAKLSQTRLMTFTKDDSKNGYI